MLLKMEQSVTVRSRMPHGTMKLWQRDLTERLWFVNGSDF